MCCYALRYDQYYWQHQVEAGRYPKTDSNESEKKKKDKNHADTSSSQQNQSKNPQASANSNGLRPQGHPSSSGNKGGSAGGSSKSGPRSPLSQKEKDECHAKGLCLYCGEPGHVYSDCPKLPTNRHQAVGRATYTFTPTMNAPESSKMVMVKAKRSKPPLPAITDTDSTKAENSSPA